MFDVPISMWRSLFTRQPTQQKASRTQTAIMQQSTRGQDAIWTPDKYDQLADEGYKQATWVYACIREITTAAKDVPIFLMRQTSDELEEVRDHPILELLERPNERMPYEAFLEATLAHHLLAGNTYIERVGPNRGAPLELWPLRPDRMRIKPDQRNGIGGYVYTVNGRNVTFEPNEIMHWRTFNPLDDWYGMSAIRAAAKGVDLWNSGMAHNVALLQNGARMSGAWVTDGELTDEQFNRMHEQSTKYEGALNAGKNLVLEAGVRWEEMGINPKDLDWLQGMRDAGRVIHAAFGVHPVLTGLQDGTFENQQQAQRGLFLRVVLPTLRHFLAELNHWLLPQYPDGETLTLIVDQDQIPALSEDQDSLYARTLNAFELGVLTRNEARAQLGFDEDPGGDAYVQDLTRPTPALLSDGTPRTTKAFNLETAEQKAAYWKAYTNRQDDWINVFQRRAASIFREEREEILEAITGSTSLASLDAVTDSIIKTDRWEELYKGTLLAVMEDFGERTQAALPTREARSRKDAQSIFRVLFGVVLDFIAAHAAEAVRQVTDTTRTQIRGIIHEGAREGLGVFEIEKRIDKLYLEQIIPNRSETIARTEIVRASNYGSQKAAEATGLNIIREWVSTIDGRTRDSHANANGQKAPMGSPFEVNGELLMYPGDPSASPEETINCRCVEVYETRD